MTRRDDEPVFVHPTAVVEDGVTIGPGSRIWHHAHLRTGAVLGRECTVGKGAFVDVHVTVGARVKVQNGAMLYQGITVGDDAFIGPHVVFTNDLRPRATNTSWEIVPTTVGQGASVAANATVVCGNHLGDWCMVGAGAVVTHPVDAHHLVVGNPARFHAWVCRCGAVVSRDVEPPESLTCSACAEVTGA